MLRAKNREQKRGFSTSFGVTIKERTFAAQNTRYQFNGKEYDSETETSDFGARNLDGDLGIWETVDKLSKLQPDQSPYKSFMNNPIYYIDKDGDIEYEVYTVVNEKTGQTKSITKVISNDIFKAENRQVEAMGGGLVDQRVWRDKIHQTTITVGKDGNVSVSKSEMLGSEQLVLSGPFRNSSNYANGLIEVDKLLNKSYEGNGSLQPGGFFLTTTGETVSSTKTKSLSDAEVLEADELISALGGLGSGKIGKDIPKQLGNFVSFLSTINNVVESATSSTKPDNGVQRTLVDSCAACGQSENDSTFNHSRRGDNVVKVPKVTRTESSNSF